MTHQRPPRNARIVEPMAPAMTHDVECGHEFRQPLLDLRRAADSEEPRPTDPRCRWFPRCRPSDRTALALDLVRDAARRVCRSDQRVPVCLGLSGKGSLV